MAGRPNAMNRQNEYFVPRDGIDREVITADICRYLGNDALVRPGTYENKETGQLIQGYYINAYRNLTTAMIDDLKEASRQWALERSRVSSGAYQHSQTHRRQQPASAVEDPMYGSGPGAQAGYDQRYGGQPTQPVYQPPPQGPAYGQQPYGAAQQGNYPQYAPQAGATYSPPPARDPYGQPAGPYPDSAYSQGSNLEARNSRNVTYGGPARVPSSGPPGASGFTAPVPPAPQYYASQPPASSYVAPAHAQSVDPFFGRAPAAGPSYTSPDPGYEDAPGRNVTPTNSSQAPQPRRGDPRDREQRHSQQHQRRHH